MSPVPPPKSRISVSGSIAMLLSKIAPRFCLARNEYFRRRAQDCSASRILPSHAPAELPAVAHPLGASLERSQRNLPASVACGPLVEQETFPVVYGFRTAKTKCVHSMSWRLSA